MKRPPCLFLSAFLLGSPLWLCAQTASTTEAALPPAFSPLLREIVKTKTPAQWMTTIQKASPTAWKTIQKRAQEPDPVPLTLADFQALPEKEQKALLTAFTPLVAEITANLTPQEQMAILVAAPQFEPDQVIAPIVNQALGLSK
ncbi:MAG: hypothetical protein SFU85_04305 [Candidatus Methylacidiphilales bacterium]|nr:hypothetical protein [Candidatus Methylacidiphilales bacterium]